MTYHTIHTGTVVGDGRTYTVTLSQKAASAPSVLTGIEILRSLVLSYGDRGDVRSSPFLESSLTFAYADPLGTLASRLASAGVNDRAFRVRVQSTDIDWYGLVVVGATRAAYYPAVHSSVVEIVAYCGLRTFGDSTGGTEEEAIWAATSPHAGLGVPIRAYVQDLPVKYVSRIRPASWRALSSGSGHWFQTSTWWASNLPTSFRAYWTPVLEALDVRVFQALSGGWRIQQAATEGTAIAANIGEVADYVGSDPLVIDATTSTLTASSISLTDGDVRASAMRIFAPRVSLVEIAYKPGNLAGFQLVRDGEFEYWINSHGPVFWEATNYFDSGNEAVTRIAGRSGDYALQINHYPAEPSNAWQALALVRGGDVYRVRAEGYVKQADMLVRLSIVSEAGNWYWYDATTGWTQTPSWRTWDNGGAGWHLRNFTTESAFPASGVLQLEFQSTSGDPRIDDLKVLLDSLRPERYSESAPPAAIYDTPEIFSGEQGTSGRKEQREITATEAERQNVGFGVTVISGIIGQQIPVSRWQDGGTAYELLATLYAGRLGRQYEIIDAEIAAILAPSTSVVINGTTWIIASGCEIDLVREQTHATLTPKPL